MKRVFIAIKINPGKDLADFIASLKSDMTDERISWTEKENIHITLAFLGDTEELMIAKVKDMLKSTCPTEQSFSILLRGAGVFKGFSDPRVLWAGIENSDKLVSLQGAIRGGLRKSGISVEERQFTPHLTLGRIRSIMNKEKLRSIIESYSGKEWQTVSVNEVTLYESILMQTGAVYRPIEIYKLRHPAL
jgi:RNA 2',3'-cyclic 3'-phosphodiesterase